MPNENTSALADNCPSKANSGDMYPLFSKKKLNEVEVVSHIRIHGFDIMGIFSRTRNEESTHTETMLRGLTPPWSLRNSGARPQSAILGFMILSSMIFPALMPPCAKMESGSSCKYARPVAVPNKMSNLLTQSKGALASVQDNASHPSTVFHTCFNYSC